MIDIVSYIAFGVLIGYYIRSGLEIDVEISAENLTVDIEFGEDN